MRLDKMKLAGFKSFVDPTTISFPSNLMGIVGPNGCGKSNTIDAVRWVMGESSAKYLRGESIADVIFNGSSGRQPLGKASVELVFDNSSGKLGGQFSSYEKISVRREIDREAQSHYYLNGTRCRRKDIMDVFLGTGLSPRSYAIVEQGMINRIIESKPQELRANFEEVAGISKYKERRRETENRIRHTKDNLSRINDLVGELDKQLEKLKRQSRAAERYKVLKGEERTFKGQLLTLRWKSLTQIIDESDELLTQGELSLEAKQSDQQHIHTQLVKLRETRNDLMQEQSTQQDRIYQLGTQITRLEQNIQHHKTRRQELETDLEQLETTLLDTREHFDSDQLQIEELSGEVEQLEPALNEAQAAYEHSSKLLADAEQHLSEWQKAWDVFNEKSSKATKTIEIEQTRIQHIEQQQEDAQSRLQKLHAERSEIDYSELKQTHQDLQEKTQAAQSHAGSCNEALKLLHEQIKERRDQNQQFSTSLNSAREALQQSRGRVASLEALQQAALGQKSTTVEWLNQQNLSQQSRLAQSLKVDAPWEAAVEAVLGDYLEAVCVDDLDPLQNVLSTLTEGNLLLLDPNRSAQSSTSNKANALSQYVSAGDGVSALLNGVYAVNTLAEAIELRSNLSAHESVVTQEGIWLGANWMRVVRDPSGKAGILQREKELKELLEQVQSEEAQVSDLTAELQQGEEALSQLETKLELGQDTLTEANNALAEVRAQLHIHQERLQALKHRAENLDSESEVLEQQTSSAQGHLQSSRETLQTSMALMENDTQEREALLLSRDECRDTLVKVREQAHHDRDESHTLEVRYQTAKSQLDALSQGCERMEKQFSSMNERRAQLQSELNLGDSPVEDLQAELTELLNKRLVEEESLQKLKQSVSEVDHQVTSQETAQAETEGLIQEIRSALEEKRLSVQEHKVRRTTLQEQLQELECDLEAVLKDLSEELSENFLEQELSSVVTKITRLGAINLAAIEELATESERKEYLDKQRADLEEALKTLEEAIHKIDHETRTRFKDVFDKVNEQFQALFPKIFGGGKAYLELTDGDLLEAGVAVMARPPGKKNSTIHLLSGGEKALTAIALVFSMFQLNPAPFCMLDEVDAPLDDANVLRYSRLVKEMSEKVQFIFITHNKITMEIADQLTGVTMNEPGVSRIVAVDVNQAAEMVEA